MTAQNPFCLLENRKPYGKNVMSNSHCSVQVALQTAFGLLNTQQVTFELRAEMHGRFSRDVMATGVRF